MNKSKITCEDAKILMMGLLDNELDNEQEKIIKDHLTICTSCSDQYHSFIKLKEGASAMKFKKLPEMYWDEYWSHVYNKIERGIGWIFFSIGLIILLIFAGYNFMESFFYDPSKPLTLKIGVGVLGIGLIVVFVSVIREKLMVKKVDKYRGIKR